MREPRPAVDARPVRHVSEPPARAGSTAAGWSWLLLVVVLAGLFAMHGLGTHGTHAAHGTEGMPRPVSSAAEGADVEDTTTSHSPGASVAHAGMAGTPSHAVDALARAAIAMSTRAMSSAVVSTWAAHLVDLPGSVRVTSQVVGGDVPAELPAAGLWGLCFAVLTALVAWLLAWRRVLRVVALVPRVTRLVAARGSCRDRDPPSLQVLSVHRC